MNLLNLEAIILGGGGAESFEFLAPFIRNPGAGHLAGNRLSR